MNGFMALGFVCGVIIGGFLLTLILKATRTDGSTKCKFDERQQVIRGRGAKYSFFTLVIFNFLFALKDEILELGKLPISDGAILFVITGISLVVYISYCIWNEGYFSLNENPKKMTLSIFGLAIANFAFGFLQLSHLNEMEAGSQISIIQIANLVCGILLVVTVIEILAKQAANKREEE